MLGQCPVAINLDFLLGSGSAFILAFTPFLLTTKNNVQSVKYVISLCVCECSSGVLCLLSQRSSVLCNTETPRWGTKLRGLYRGPKEDHPIGKVLAN